MTINHSQVLNAFQPAKEITDPKKFSGRKDQLERGTELLLSGDHAFIYGPRGIGKSSIARQLKNIASGDSQLLEALDSDLKNEKLDYATCYITRDASINNLNQLLYRILIDKEGFDQFNYLFEEFGKPPTNYSQGQALDPQLVSDFWMRAQSIADRHQNGLAIFVDEFELIQHHEGFASFLKAAKKKVIFFVTGIGSTEKELVRDHRSIERQLATGKLPLPPMSEEDLLKVIQTAEHTINREICFTSEAKASLVKAVRGQPFLLHLIGKECLTTSFKQKRNQVDEGILGSAFSTIATKQISSELEVRYLASIGNSPQREITLRAFAEMCNPTAHTSDVYPKAIEKGVSNPSYYTGDLQKALFGEELRKDADKYYSFKDLLFQAYVKATPSRLGKSNGGEPSTQSGAKERKNTKNILEVLHFSDIHFGDTHYFSNIPISVDTVPERDKPTFDSTLIKAIEHEGIKPDVLVVSGDLTQRGTTAEFNKAAKSLNAILEHLGESGETPKIVTCPGNHDVNWAALDADPDAKYMAFQGYVAFRNKLANSNKIDSAISPDRLYEIIKVETTPNLILTSLNSAVVEKQSDHRGYIGESQLRDAIREANAIAESDQAIKIAVFHHHLTAVASTDMKVAPEEVMSDAPFTKQFLQKNGFQIALHGHRHQGHAELTTSDQGNQLLVIGCGSSGVQVIERGEQPLQFLHLRIDTSKKKTFEVKINTYIFHSNSRQWTKELRETRTFLLDKIPKAKS